MHTADMAAHFDNVDESAMQPGGVNHFTAEDVQNTPTVVIGKICNIYHTIRPFVSWASKFILIPKKVKTVLRSFMELMDTVCPAT